MGALEAPSVAFDYNHCQELDVGEAGNDAPGEGLTGNAVAVGGSFRVLEAPANISDVVGCWTEAVKELTMSCLLRGI